MKTLKVLLAQLRTAKKYGSKSRIAGLILKIAQYKEPKAIANPENSQVVVMGTFYATVAGFLLKAINKEIESDPTEKLLTDLARAGYTDDKIDVAEALGIHGSVNQQCWAVRILQQNWGWAVTAIKAGLLPTKAGWFIQNRSNLPVLLDYSVEF
jgi:hypothetical protein